MPRLLMAGAALVALVACAAAAHPLPEPAPAQSTIVAATPLPADATAQHGEARAQITCDIRATPSAHGVTIEAVVASAQPVAGDYHLVITKTGASGSSDIDQGGPFTVHANLPTTLGSSEIGLGRGDHYHAVLTLTGPDNVLCRAERSS